MEKKRIFSGIQPSGNLHIGNYLGAIKNWVALQDEYESIFCVVDMHAITASQEPEALRKKTIEIAKIYLAAGIDPQKSTIFVQSHVKAHAELCWILNSVTARMGDLEKMTQFKDKARLDFQLIDEIKHKIEIFKEKRKISDDLVTEFTNFIEAESDILNSYNVSSEDDFKNFILKRYSDLIENSQIIVKATVISKEAQNELVKIIKQFYDDFQKRKNATVGLLDYPVLMAGDILLYDTQTVPVGQDQVQHVELARTLVRRFNKRFGETFVVPEYFVKEEGKMIMGLDNPEKKMSKSATSEYNYISLMDDADSVHKKIRKAVTDSGEEIVYCDDKPALKNLINIYALLANVSTQEVEKKFVGKRYGDFKNDLAETIVEFLVPFQKRMAEISDEDVLRVLRNGAKRADEIAEKKIQEVKEKVGFVI
jgi:tryptophanyl-tRNA synthetase